MQGLHRRVMIAMALACTATAASAQFDNASGPDRGSWRSISAYSETRPTHYEASRHLFKPMVYQVSGARLVKLHFSRFNLPPGVSVEISNPDGTESWRYSSSTRDPFTLDEAIGDDGENSFWAMSISGDTALVRLTGNLHRFDPMLHGIEIDRHFSDGVEPELSKTLKSAKGGDDALETNCGESELYDAICWQDSHPDMVERASPVALVIATSGKKCTAWRAGSKNRMFTARHCIASQSELDGAEIWFNYESAVCGGEEQQTAVKVTGGDLLSQDYHLDYALFTVDDFSSISGFGNLGLDLRDGTVGEGIFIPQHGLADPKQIAIESDMNLSGLCEIDDTAMNGFSEGSDIGYMCDTTTSSSGSPVISGLTGRAIALHHWGGCFNSGTKLSRIWPEVKDFFNGIVPKGDAKGDWADANELPSADFMADCDALSCVFDGIISSDPDGSITSWDWQIDNEESTGASAEHTFSKAGEFEVVLTVTDDEGASQSVTEMVSVTVPNEKPQAKFSAACVDNACTFNAGASNDEDGDVVDWAWNLGDGSSASDKSVEHSYSKAGSYSVSLIVTDNDQGTDTTSHTVTLTMPNEKPEASFSGSCKEGVCSFDATDSHDPDGQILQYEWSFGDGGSARGKQAEHRYEQEGSFTIKVTVFDDQGASASTRRLFDIMLPPEEPVADFQFSCEDRVCELDAGSSTSSEASITRYDWAFGDGATGAGSAVTHQYDKNGTYTVTLKITTSDKTSSRKRTILVESQDEAELTAEVSMRKNRPLVSLSWSNLNSEAVDIYRNQQRITTVLNAGRYFDQPVKSNGPRTSYRVCEAGTQHCSNTVKLQLLP